MSGSEGPVVPLFPVRRGPKPKVAAADLAAIRTDLATSPFIGEGHRKVWTRLRILRCIRVSKTRVLRLMGENQLLSHHRQPKGVANLHDGTIIRDRNRITEALMIEATREPRHRLRRLIWRACDG